MAGRGIDRHGLGDVRIDPEALRRLAVHCADRTSAKHPTEWDETDPAKAAHEVAQDPAAHADLLELRDLLDEIGYTRKEQQ